MILQLWYRFLDLDSSHRCWLLAAAGCLASPQNGPKKGSCANLRFESPQPIFARAGASVKERKARVAELSSLRRLTAAMLIDFAVVALELILLLYCYVGCI